MSVQFKTPKIKAAEAQCDQVFDYFSRRGMDLTTFKEYVTISDSGEIKIALPTNRASGSPLLAAAIKLQFDLIINQDKAEAQRLAELVLNTVR